MHITFNDFKREYEVHKNELETAVHRVMASGWYILGPEVKAFEEKFAKMLNTKHVIGVANGMEALQIALMALDIGEGDEVITTSMSAVATALSIAATGAKPVFADIDKHFHIDAADIAKKITAKTKAIIPVHLYGQAANMDEIKKLADKHNLKIVEDCAQAVGAQHDGKTTGTIGHIGCYSFYPTKNLGAYGDAGAIATSDDALAEKCRAIRNYGQKNRYEHEMIGLNSRLDEMQAAILSTKLGWLAHDNARRAEIAQIYQKGLSNIPGVQIPALRTGANHVYHLFVITCERRDELQKFLKDAGIDSIVHYPIPIHKQKCFHEHNSVSLPVTERAAASILSLPIHPYMTDAEVEYVCANVRKFYGV